MCCENNNVNGCNGTCSEAAVTPCTSAAPVKDAYVSSLVEYIQSLEHDLKNAKFNQDRFQLLYSKSLSGLIQILEALKSNDINTIEQIVSSTISALKSIEADDCK